MESGFPVRYSETDPHGRLRPIALLNYLQDAAAAHTQMLGVSVRALLERRLAWVLSRLHLQVERYPLEGEQVRVVTWPSIRGDRFTCREFEVEASGEVVARATTSWGVLDATTRRAASVGLLPTYPVAPRRAIADDFPSLPQVARNGESVCFRALRDDLDINGHVNFTVYVRWGLETVPDEVGADFFPSSIEVGYRGEIFAGDEVAGYCRPVDCLEGRRAFLHALATPEGREVTRLRTVWNPRRR